MSVRRRSLMLSCASLAIAAAAMAPREARAQAFNGTMAPTTSATQTFTGTGTETITVNSSTATINWTPDNSGTGNINFLPSANRATFTSASGIIDYTVLNRIVPLDATRAIELNGTVLSTLEGGATTGGNVWFYSPGGIVVGASAVFDVGGLLLSTIDLSSFSNSTYGFSASFAKTQTGAGAIQILDGATLNALQQNSYIALVAPRIEQGGNVRVNGSAAYVAAEQLTMTMSQGLFDIQVDVATGGTADANGIVHTGSTTGPANETASHNIYMAAVPKNQALTMLLSGTVGYDATTAFVDNGEIILSAGKTPSYYGFSGWSAITEGAIQITGGNFTSDVRAVANTGVYADTSTGPLSFAGNIWFEANGPVVLSAFEGQALTVGGDAWLGSPVGAAGQVTIAASSGGSIDIGGDALLLSQGQLDGTNTIGGNVNVTADGGNVTIDGYLEADVSAYAWQSDINGNSSDAYGGNITLLATNGGTLTAGDVYADASADGGDTQGGGDGIAGNGQGGSITVQSDFGGAVHVIGGLDATAYGSGGYISGSGVAAGTGQGGNILLTANGGAIRTGWLYGSAGGSGGSVYAESTTMSGATGQGGFVRLVTHDVASSITVDDSVYLDAGGYGGSGLNGGTGYGGSAGIQSFAGAIAIGGSVGLSAYAGGGSAYGGYGGTGGSAYGGEAYIQAQVTNGPVSSISAGDVYLNVGAFGGYGGAGDGGQIAAGAGGYAQGGLFNGQIGSGGAFVLADAAGATLQLGYVSMYADAYGGTGGTGGANQAGGAGGDASGGFVQAGGFNPTGTTNPTGSATFGDVYMSAGAYGGSGGAGDNGLGGAPAGNGGNASGGGNSICGETGQACGGAVLNAKGDVTTDSIYMYAGAYGGSGATGGNALGGKAFVQSFPNSTLASSGSVTLQATGFGGWGYSGTGGAGTGGLAFVGVQDNSTMSVAGRLYVDSGGDGGYGVTGGAATGGESYLEASTGALLTAGELLLWSPGYGGSGDTVGGNAIGGTTATLINGGTVSAGSLGQYASAWGGYGETGGNATGGIVSITYSPSGGTITSGNTYLEADGFGGGGVSGSGGSGTGGDVDVAVTAASAFNAGWLDMSASGVGGYSDSGAAGAGVGGTSTALVTAGGTLSAGYFGNFADANGGSSTTGSGGSASAGAAEVIADGGVISIGDSGLRVGADGTGGTGSSAGADGRGGRSSLAITVNGGSISVTGYTEMTANGGLTGGKVLVGVEAGGAANLGNATLAATGGSGTGSVRIDVGAGGTAEAPVGGNVLFANNITMTSSGTIDVLSQNGAGINVTDTFAATADGLVSLDDQSNGASLTATGISLQGAGVFSDWAFDAGGDIYLSSSGNLQTGNMTAVGAINLDAGGDILFGNASADTFDFDAGGAATGGNVTAVTQANGDAEGAILLGNITVGPGLVPSTDFSVGFSSATSITVGNVQSVDRVGFATLGTLTTGDIIAGSLVMTLVGGDISLGSITTNPDATVYLADASMFVAAGGEGDFNLEQVLGAAPVATGGSISIGGPVSTGTLKAAAGSDLSIADVGAANSVALSANGLASFLGVVSAPEISVTSGDITIAAGASLGKAGVTQVLNLFAVSSNSVVIGNSGAASSAAAAEGSRYVLDEEGDIVAGTVNFTAQSGTGGTAPDIIVHNVTIEGSQTEGGGVGTVNVSTGGNIIVDGHLLYTNAATTDSLSLNAGNSIQAVTDNGGVAMTASDGSLSGTLLLTADNIWVGDQALIDQLIADPNFAGRNQALATNNGAANPDGSIRAGAITANISETLLVQNSGTGDDYAGLSVGDGGLTVNNTASTPATVIAYGRQVNSDGTVSGGSAFAQSVEFTGNFSDESRLNGCAVGGTCTTVAEQSLVPGPEAILGPVGLMTSSTDAAPSAAEESSESEEEEGESESESESSVDPSVQLINSGPLQLDQSVDQPVTSGSDAMLTDGPPN